MAYLDGGMIYSHDNGTSIRTNISINDCLPGHLDSALMKVFYTDISDPFNPVNDSILFPLDSVRVNDRYLLKSSDIVRFAGAVRVDKITLDIPRYFISYIDSTTHNVNRGQSLLFYYNWDIGLFSIVENPISINYDINYALELVSIDGEGRILQHRSGDSVTYSYDFYLKDHLGSTRMVINDQNSITEKVAYQSYGTINPLDSSSPALPSREKFTGKEFDTQGADFARVEFDIAVKDFDMSSGSGFIRVGYRDVATGNEFSKIYMDRYDSKNRALRFTGSESFTGEVEIEQMFLMVSGAPGGIFNIVPIDSFLVSLGKTRKIQLDVASSEIVSAPIDTNFYSVHASVDNRSYFSGTRLFYFGARYYDPELGIWLSVDRKGQYWDPYGYCNHPIMYVDPDGNFFFLGALLGAAGTALGVAGTAAGVAGVGAGVAGIGVGTGVGVVGAVLPIGGTISDVGATLNMIDGIKNTDGGFINKFGGAVNSAVDYFLLGGNLQDAIGHTTGIFNWISGGAMDYDYYAKTGNVIYSGGFMNSIFEAYNQKHGVSTTGSEYFGRAIFTIFGKGSDDYKATVAHEMRHSRQMEDRGRFVYWAQYLKQNKGVGIASGYNDNPFEIEARFYAWAYGKKHYLNIYGEGTIKDDMIQEFIEEYDDTPKDWYPNMSWQYKWYR